MGFLSLSLSRVSLSEGGKSHIHPDCPQWRAASGRFGSRVASRAGSCPRRSSLSKTCEEEIQPTPLQELWQMVREEDAGKRGAERALGCGIDFRAGGKLPDATTGWLHRERCIEDQPQYRKVLTIIMDALFH